MYGKKKSFGGGSGVSDRAESCCNGWIDSVYCGSGVDGKGLRCVVFFSGCNLRCPFCHNPETLYKQGERTDVGALVKRLERYRAYFRRGGVTLSGGEPFLQREFCLALLKALSAGGIHTCAETNGHIADGELISACDEIICDIKNQEGNDLSAYDDFLALCGEKGTSVRVTNVLVPEKNDSAEKLRALASLLYRHGLGEVQFLPFRKLCAEKYESLSVPFPYHDVREAEEEDISRAKDAINRYLCEFAM